eukprot:TRINITY_DN6565_c0_g1_i1.p1 TRINITY_DN6565_c0_g1~~TRINITY_DN6565_c0_g1_i1.p1  ORF type:complete len:407 (-),score=75.32 TRINITY_DN6565_c0_g1_i1:91-1311(-)
MSKNWQVPSVVESTTEKISSVVTGTPEKLKAVSSAVIGFGRSVVIGDIQPQDVDTEMSELVLDNNKTNEDDDIEIEDGSYSADQRELLRPQDGDSDDDDEYIDETMPTTPEEPQVTCCTPAWWSVPQGSHGYPRWRHVFFRWRTLFIAIVLAGFVTVLYLFSKHNSPIRAKLYSFFDFLDKEVPVGWGAVVFAEVYAICEAAFLPGTPFDLAAGFAFGPWIGSASAWIGATVGSVVAFWFGRTLLRKWAAKKLRSNPKLRALDRAIGENTFKLVLLTRLSPVLPNPLLSYVYGVTKVSFPSYLLASFLGFGPMTILYSYFGSILRDVAEIFDPDDKTRETQKKEKIITLVVAIITTIAIMIVVTYITRRALASAMDEKKDTKQERRKKRRTAPISVEETEYKFERG